MNMMAQRSRTHCLLQLETSCKAKVLLPMPSRLGIGEIPVS